MIRNKYQTSCYCLILVASFCISISSCKKENTIANPSNTDTTFVDTGFITYTIRQGQQYCDQNTLKLTNLSSQSFDVIFDSSAIYRTIDPNNQYDINKLYGFSEGFNHQYNSARLGWRWSDDSLRLFGYVYNNGARISSEISTVTIGDTIRCSISLLDSFYQFSVNQRVLNVSRTAIGTIAIGYQLYPYFGGDETAPQAIAIKIKELR
ncbi:MAG: hypothetical protein ACOYLP_11105 [Flavobacterium sp.]|uniref:hypothetical protein n=1 Tax=Flavobacterium sp. TaxID=239 RepID=UPI003BE96CD3